MHRCFGSTSEVGGCKVNTSTRTDADAGGGKPKNIKMFDFWRDTGPAHAANASAGETYEETIFLNEALRVVANLDLTSDAAKPLFLYYATHVAHLPYEVPPVYESQFEFIDVEERRVYHAMVKPVTTLSARVCSECALEHAVSSGAPRRASS